MLSIVVVESTVGIFGAEESEAQHHWGSQSEWIKMETEPSVTFMVTVISR